jgi:hypothetical protein
VISSLISFNPIPTLTTCGYFLISNSILSLFSIKKLGLFESNGVIAFSRYYRVIKHAGDPKLEIQDEKPTRPLYDQIGLFGGIGRRPKVSLNSCTGDLKNPGMTLTSTSLEASRLIERLFRDMGDLLLIQVSAALFATKVVTFAAGPNGWGFDQRYHFEIKSSVVSLTETNSPRSPRCWG